MKKIIVLLSAVLLVANTALALDAAVQAKVDGKKAEIAEWGKDPALVAAVKDLSTSPLAVLAGMDQKTWESLTIIDPKIRAVTGSKVSEFLKSKKAAWVSEAFVSVADGTKVGFLAKTTSWSHKGKAKHDDPMAGKTWQGELEVDKSTGREQVQVAVPVLDAGSPIGSLVVGLDVGKL